MTVLALRMSRRINGVSALHGRVSRDMWQSLWSGKSAAIGHVTNGVLWETHQTLKARTLDFVRRRVTEQESRSGATPELLENLRRSLNLDTLTTGFARRFAEYKRSHMLLGDLQLLDQLINNPHVPVQFLFAGKAHPQDAVGKGILQRIDRLNRDPCFAGKIVFVEDYDMNTARHLLPGVDVRLNNPRRPLEPSGASGRKVVPNGGLNLCVLDGWWAEAYDGRNGFAIGNGTYALQPGTAGPPRYRGVVQGAARGGRPAVL